MNSLDAVSYMQRVRVCEPGEGVDVVDLLVAQLHAVAPVERADVVLDGLHQTAPLVWDVLRGLPAVRPRILDKRKRNDMLRVTTPQRAMCSCTNLGTR